MNTEKTEDPVDKLGKDLAADHTLEKARAETAPAVDDEETEELESEAEAEPIDDGEFGEEASFIGDFESYDAVRDFAGDNETGLALGDLAVVNGGLVRVTKGGGFEIVVPSLLDEYAFTGLHSDAHEREMQKLERIAVNADFESGSLLDDVRDTLILLYKSQRVLWSGRSQAEQRDLGKQIEAQAKTLIKKIARVVAEGEQISVAGKLERYTHSGSFDLKITAQSDEEAAMQLFRMQGHDVVILSADSSRFLESSSELETDPDEPSLFADGEEPDDVEEYVPPEDDSDLAGDDEEEAAGDPDPDEPEPAETKVEKPAGKLRKPSFGATSIPSPGKAEPAADDFTEASEEEVAKQQGRPGNPAGDDAPAADYVGPKEPAAAIPGETWVDTSKEDSRPRHKHPNGRWYLSAPREDDLEEWRSQQGDEFPSSPE